MQCTSEFQQHHQIHRNVAGVSANTTRYTRSRLIRLTASRIFRPPRHSEAHAPKSPLRRASRRTFYPIFKTMDSGGCPVVFFGLPIAAGFYLETIGGNGGSMVLSGGFTRSTYCCGFYLEALGGGGKVMFYSGYTCLRFVEGIKLGWVELKKKPNVWLQF